METKNPEKMETKKPEKMVKGLLYIPQHLMPLSCLVVAPVCSDIESVALVFARPGYCAQVTACKRLPDDKDTRINGAKKVDTKEEEPSILPHHEEEAPKFHTITFCESSNVQKDNSSHQSKETSPKKSPAKRKKKKKLGPDKYKCEYCGAKFRRGAHIKRHLRIHTGEKPFECFVCGRKFAAFYTLKIHQVVHTRSRDHACQHCDKRYSHRSTLMGHLRQVHNIGGDPFVCSTCGQTAPSRKDLARHIASHSDLRPHVCHICNKGFAADQYLRKHLLCHGVNRKQQCLICGKWLQSMQSLRLHLRNHNPSSKFTCTTCGKEFSTEKSLSQHSSVHDNNGPWPCAECGLNFKTKWILKGHQNKIHGERKWFECAHCYIKYNYKSHLVRHMLTSHQEELNKNRTDRGIKQEITFHENNIVDVKPC